MAHVVQAMAQRMVDEIMLEIPPLTIPVAVKDLTGADVRLDTPGIEVDFKHPNGNEYFVIPLAIADFDYAGQACFFQIAVRGENPDNVHVFGEYRYFFAYRAGDVGWENWQTDINFGTERPTHATFGTYCDEEIVGDVLDIDSVVT